MYCRKTGYRNVKLINLSKVASLTTATFHGTVDNGGYRSGNRFRCAAPAARPYQRQLSRRNVVTPVIRRQKNGSQAFVRWWRGILPYLSWARTKRLDNDKKEGGYCRFSGVLSEGTSGPYVVDARSRTHNS